MDMISENKFELIFDEKVDKSALTEILNLNQKTIFEINEEEEDEKTIDNIKDDV